MENTHPPKTESKPSKEHNTSAKIIKLLNPKREELTTAILKTFPAYQHLTDSEAEEKCQGIRVFASLLLQYISSVEKNTFIDNQHLLSLNHQETENIVPLTKQPKKRRAA